MSSAWVMVIPMSSRPFKKRCCVGASIGKLSLKPADGTSTVRRSMSTVISVVESASMSSHSFSTAA